MKNTIFLILGGVAISIIALYLISKMDSDKGTGFNLYNNKDQSFGAVKKNYKSSKMEAILSPDANYPLETELLQKWINLYMGYDAVAINGVYNDQTADAVSRITGKSSTTLREIITNYMAVKPGMTQKANDIKMGIY